jgi:methionyl-tRNA synthetase
MKEYKRYLITAALPYANGPVHIGHLAGVYVPADIYVRYLRMNNKDVLFVCGSDEHGVPITIKAMKENCSPQDIVDRYDAIIRKSFEEFGISFSNYSRTSHDLHTKVSSDFFKTLYDKGEFVEQTSEQYYDEEAKQFLADRYIVGTCPKCGAEGAYGDQCEKCGSSLSPDELINPVSKLSGSPLVKKPTKHWYLPLDKHEDFLRKWILEDHKEWKSNVYGQCKSWLDGGLHPRAVSRDLDWVFRFRCQTPKEKFYTCGLTHLSVTLLLRRNVLPIGRNIGNRKILNLFILSGKIISCSTASCSP